MSFRGRGGGRGRGRGGGRGGRGGGFGRREAYDQGPPATVIGEFCVVLDCSIVHTSAQR